jgi:mRNA-degrading endonuclease RelE of RelBE toxin-antitoxin system
MAHEVWADPGFQWELAALPGEDRKAVEDALPGLARHPADHPQTVRLKGSAYPGSFRLRVGRLRVLGLALDGPRLILLTTVFLKRRDSDYDAALLRHERRLKAQGPPLGDQVKGAMKGRPR